MVKALFPHKSNHIDYKMIGIAVVVLLFLFFPETLALGNDTGDFEDVLRENYRGPVAFVCISSLLFCILMLSCLLYVNNRGNLHNPDATTIVIE